MPTKELEQLENGPLYSFSDWPNAKVPRVAAGVYTIWRSAELVYVGMSGRKLTQEAIEAHRAKSARNKGLYSRLASHAAGRRSGDQFCVYVADRLVLPTLSSTQLAEIANGETSFDALLRIFIHKHLMYMFVEVRDDKEAFRIEAQIREGCLKACKPLLNPSKMKETRSGRKSPARQAKRAL